MEDKLFKAIFTNYISMFNLRRKNTVISTISAVLVIFSWATGRVLDFSLTFMFCAMVYISITGLISEISDSISISQDVSDE